jgi:sugar lactone lactonase YvrE
MIRLLARSLTLLLVALNAPAALAQDMPLAQILQEGDDWQLVAEGYTFTEGPAVDAAGNLFFVDVPASNIYKLDVATKRVTLFAENTGRASGLVFGSDGRLYACQNGNRAIVAYDAAGQATRLAEGLDVNDLCITRAGRIYVTDPKNHQVWLVEPDGQKRVVDTGIERPNGITLWPDQRTLVVADSAGEHLWTFRIADDGSLQFKQPYYTLQLTGSAILAGKTASGADGMKCDSLGRLYVATQAGLQVCDTQGRLAGIILKPAAPPDSKPLPLSNVCFAGPRLATLYITCGSKLYARKTKASGLASLSAAAN